jgi:hypothetical protein
MNELALYDIMGEDHEIWAKKVDETHVKVEVFNEHQDMVYQENSHVFAWEALVGFAKQVLAVDARMTQETEAYELDLEEHDRKMQRENGR